MSLLPLQEQWSRLRLRFDETMSGTHVPVSGPQAGTALPFSFHIDCEGTGLDRYLNFFDSDFLCHKIQGTVHASGLASAAALEGDLALRYLREQKIYYSFLFDSDDGRRLSFSGEKRDIYPWNIWKSHFELFGAIREVETGDTLSTVEARFAYADLTRYMQSFRVVLK